MEILDIAGASNQYVMRGAAPVPPCHDAAATETVSC